VFVIGVTVAITVLALVRSFNICPDGGDEIWHHAPTTSYIPEMLAGVVAVVLLLLILQAATGWAFPGLGLVYVLVLASYLVSRYRSPSRSTSSARG
jgi:hypothetical protein